MALNLKLIIQKVAAVKEKIKINLLVQSQSKLKHLNFPH
jgi:hypothetical protein